MARRKGKAMGSQANYKYLEIYHWAKTLILSGIMRHGDAFPSEHMLQNKFGFSRQTVRTALQKLVVEGLLVARRGSGYYVSYQWQSPGARQKSVGLIMSYFADYLFPQIYAGIQSVLDENVYSLDVGVTRNDLNEEALFLQRFLNHNVNGLIVEGTRSAFPNPNLWIYKEYLARHIPIVFIHSHYAELPVDGVEMDDYQCGYELMRILVEKGHEKICGIFKYDDQQGVERYRGFIHAAQDFHIPIDDHHILWFSTKDRSYALSKAQLRKFRQRSRHCTALMAYNDETAYQFLNAFQPRIRVPDELSIVSFDHAQIVSDATLKLCTAEHPQFELGRVAAARLVKRLQSPSKVKTPHLYRFPVSIVEGNSVKDLRAGRC